MAALVSEPPAAEGKLEAKAADGGTWQRDRQDHPHLPRRDQQLDRQGAGRAALPARQASKREEVRRTGVYLLVGPDQDDPSRALAYVGVGDNVLKRPRQ